MFDMNAPTYTEAFAKTRKELTLFMADYSNTATAPKAKKGGWYAMVGRTSGKVWLAETKNHTAQIHRYRTKSALPAEVKAMVDDGEELSLFLTTKEFDVDQLRFALEESNSLLHRGTRTNNGEGKLYVVTHNSGHYYLTKTRCEKLKDGDVLTKFIRRVLDLRQTNHQATNKPLQQFVTDNAGDLLRETGFEVRVVDTFKDSEHAVELMNQYYIDQKHLTCLNHVFDHR